VAQTITIGEQKIAPKSDFLKIIFTVSEYSRPNYPCLVVVAYYFKICWNNTLTCYKKGTRNTEIVNV